MEQIACKECTSPDCHGCNMYRLERMLMSGKLNALMDENRAIKMDADVRPVVLCKDCKHWEADWTPQGVSEGRHYCAPLDLFPSADWYCADGEKREES